MKKVLIVEDEREIVNIIKDYCIREDFEPIIAYDGQTAIVLFERWNPDILIVDIMLPRMDGFGVLREVRKTSSVPVIILSSRSLIEDRMRGLIGGADLYLTKPFEPMELMAYMNKLCKKVNNDIDNDQISVRDISINVHTNMVLYEGKQIHLTPTEMRILQCLMSNMGTVFSKTQILDLLSDEYNEADSNTVTVHISNIRDKLKKIGIDSGYIATVWGMGYVINEDA